MPLSATINSSLFFFECRNLGCHSARVCVCVCVSARVRECVVTDVHPVAAGTALHIRHVLSDSDGQQVVLLIIQYILIFSLLSLSLSLSLSLTVSVSLSEAK